MKTEADEYLIDDRKDPRDLFDEIMSLSEEEKKEYLQKHDWSN